MLADADAANLGGTVVDTEVCVVGAGPAGIALGLELAGGSLDVVILESGGGDGTDRVARSLTGGENADNRYYRLTRSRIRGFAGSANHWMPESGMRARPLDPIDFDARPEIDRVGWPFGRDHLDPYYARAQAICGLGPYDYDLATWEDPAKAPALPLPRAEGFETAMFQVAALGRFQAHREPLAHAGNVRVVTGATVLELVTDAGGGQVEEARVATTARRPFTVRAQRFVLAAGGLENARLLLLSRRATPAGLGNGNGLVGRSLMEHPHVRTGWIAPSDPELASRLGLYDRRPADGFEVLAKLAVAPEVLRREGLLASAWGLHPVPAATVTSAGRALVALRETAVDFRRPVASSGRRVAAVATRPMEAVRAAASARPQSPRDAILLSAMTEQEPNPASRVTLGRRRDRFGQPVARVDWRLTDRDLRAIRRAQELLDGALRDAGLGRVVDLLGEEDPPVLVGGGFHHMGTTRMHASPDQGVVDPDARVHGVDNLYVTGQSVFPTGGYANPTLTVVALALRLADHLRTPR